MEQDYGFCTRCGATHEPGAEYCPQCGKSFTGDDRVQINNRMASNPLMFFIILLGIFAAISLGEGVIATFFNDSLIDYVKTVNGDGLPDYLASLGLDTIDQLADILFKQGVLTLADGILVAIVFVLCIRRRFWKIAVITCLAATTLVVASFLVMTPKMMEKELFSMVIQTAIGLLITRGIYINRRIFR